MGQTTRNQVPISAQKNMFILVPPIDEQIKLVEKIYGVTGNFEVKKKYLEQLQKLKKSLMQDLLTGKVRVQVN